MGAKQDGNFLTFGSYIFDNFKMAWQDSRAPLSLRCPIFRQFLQQVSSETVSIHCENHRIKRVFEKVAGTFYIARHKSYLPIQQPTSILLNGSTFSFLQHHHGLRFVALFKLFLKLKADQLEFIFHKQIILFMPTTFFWRSFDS